MTPVLRRASELGDAGSDMDGHTGEGVVAPDIGLTGVEACPYINGERPNGVGAWVDQAANVGGDGPGGGSRPDRPPFVAF
jgi:hypothetical protein